MLFLALSCCAAVVYAQQNTTSSSLPTVDLGYTIQRASTFNDTGNYYTFSNIRFAAPPTGDLRWRTPQPPLTNRTIQDGSIGYNCPAANAAWAKTAYSFLPQYLAGKTNFTLPTPSNSTPSLNPSQSEDCLFLDVIVPEKIFEKGDGCEAPVLVWIHGGGFTSGSKTALGSPAGLLARSQDQGGDGVVFVALNYRLGAFGWLSGPTFQSSNGISNAGFYDQRAALKWVQKHISKFGGDPRRITVIGESAGGSSIMHQITAYGGSRPAPFQQAIIQSPAFMPVVSKQQQEITFDSFLSLANVSTLDEARRADTTTLLLANALQIRDAAYGKTPFGPVVDGVFAPQLPGQLLARGQFAKNIRKLMLAYNADEGLFFTAPSYPNSNSVFQKALTTALPTLAAWPDVLAYITNTLYPITSYPNGIARNAKAISDFVFVCNTRYLETAFPSSSYAYLFAVPPGLHGFDVGYTFFNGGPGINATVAGALQDYITSFAIKGEPNEEGVPFFPMYGNGATIQVLNSTGIGGIVDPARNGSCEWWQKALYY